LNKSKLFEDLHRTRPEPFEYGRRAAEIVRHRFIVGTVRRFCPQPTKLLDVGCSVGQLTRLLGALADTTTAVDLSRTAMARVRETCRAAPGSFRFSAAGATALPFRGGAFDVVVLADGLNSWQLTAPERRLALAEAYRTLRPGGYVVLTEYLRPVHFAEFIQLVRESPLEVSAIIYLHDRLWYQVESWFKAVRGRRWVERIFRSLVLASVLRFVSRIFGPLGSRHICIVARAPAPPVL
jgi:ubiquinone/menaquinone biosynthesis C-methylase UbiE